MADKQSFTIYLIDFAFAQVADRRGVGKQNWVETPANVY
jgi:hypothetical protein